MIHHQWHNEFGVGAIVDRLADLPEDWGEGLPEGQDIWVASITTIDVARQTAVREMLRLVTENADLKRLRSQDAETLRDQGLEIAEKHDRIVALAAENQALKAQIARDCSRRGGAHVFRPRPDLGAAWLCVLCDAPAPPSGPNGVDSLARIAALELEHAELKGTIATLQRGRESLDEATVAPLANALAEIAALEAEVERLRAINRKMAATCTHPDMVTTQEGPLDV